MKKAFYKYLFIVLIIFITTNMLYAQENIWEFIGGEVDLPDYSQYGSLGVPSVNNSPDRTKYLRSWMDLEGNFWVFGGRGYDSVGHYNHNIINELWKYNTAENTWTRMKEHTRQSLGIKGVANPKNSPSNYLGGANWKDNKGNFWLYDIDGTMWMFDISITQWIWVSGEPKEKAPAIYNEQNIPYESNSPGMRSSALSWVGKNGDFWLFGGKQDNEYYSDLWKYDISTKLWVWVLGDSVTNQRSYYGSGVVPIPVIRPGGRSGSKSWTDNNGNFWLLGGYGLSSFGHLRTLNDLWFFDFDKQEWTFMGGPKSVYEEFPENWPRDISTQIIWSDNKNNLWMFGGSGHSYHNPDGPHEVLNEVWKYDISANQWNLEFSSPNRLKSSLHIKGQESPENIPVGSGLGTGVADKDGNLIMFGGGYSTINAGKPYHFIEGNIYNVLWKYNTQTGLWNWLSGIQEPDQRGIYGTKGVESPDNKPGARRNAMTFKDKEGNYWLFGGIGRDINNNYSYLNDLWKYNNNTGNWTWISGSEFAADEGSPGTTGVASPLNTPRGRAFAASWTDSEGNFWIYGGKGYSRYYIGDLWKFDIKTYLWTRVNGEDDLEPEIIRGIKGIGDARNFPGGRSGAMVVAGNNDEFYLYGGKSRNGLCSDIWKFSTTTKLWTWIGGSEEFNAPYYKEDDGILSDLNTPGGRYSSAIWMDDDKNIWLFGGNNSASGYVNGYANSDLWKYNIDSNQWAYEKGNLNSNSFGNYGEIGIYSPENWPGAREMPNFWKDTDGNFWLFGGAEYEYSPFMLDAITNARNDLWKFDTNKKMWVWVSGSQDTPHPIQTGETVSPGGRFGAAIWQNENNKITIFGGTGYDASTYLHLLNDMWQLNLCGAVPEAPASGVDENCDGLYLWYLDEDQDGEGGTTIVSSPNQTPGIGESDNNIDCDDKDPEINSRTIWYEDLDGDGFGNASISIIQCTQPENFVRNDLDCHDRNPEWNLSSNPPKPQINVIEVSPGYILLESDYSEGNQWYKDGEIMLGEINQRLKSNHEGTFTLKVLNNSCETQLSNPVNYIKSPQYYPNPVKDILNVKIATVNIGKKASIFIINPSGKTVNHYEIIPDSENLSLNVSHLKPGIYLVKIITENDILVFRINKK